MIFCTLFDSGYLDKGLALYHSMKQVMNEFKLYVFAFDDMTETILKEMDLSEVIVINIENIETDEMRAVKKERSKAEYCWTTTPTVIEHVLSAYNEEICTYLDADLYFFSSPSVLFEEMETSNSSIIITEHRFPTKNIERNIKDNGKYCVQFNTFLNDNNGRKALSWWKEKTIESCYYSRKGEVKGDQKYLESFVELFDGVHELQHLGGGVAPWNICKYSLKDEKNMIFLEDEHNFKLIFYHFQNIRYLPFGYVNIKSSIKDKKMRNLIYFPYLSLVETIRFQLKNDFGIAFTIKKSYYKNPILKFIQNYIMPFKLRTLKDIISLRKVRK